MSPDDFGKTLCRVAERSGWAFVTQYEPGPIWVVNKDETSSARLRADERRQLVHAHCEVIPMAETTGDPVDTLRLLMTANGESGTTGGLTFALTSDGAHVLLAASLRLEIDDERCAEELEALFVRAAEWRAVLGAPVDGVNLPADADFFIRA